MIVLHAYKRYHTHTFETIRKKAGKHTYKKRQGVLNKMTGRFSPTALAFHPKQLKDGKRA